MDVLGHEDEGMELKLSFAAIAVKSVQEEADIVLDNEEPSALPRREGNEVSSGRRDESSRLQEQTSAAKAAIFAQPKPARVELVPFPVVFLVKVLILGSDLESSAVSVLGNTQIVRLPRLFVLIAKG